MKGFGCLLRVIKEDVNAKSAHNKNKIYLLFNFSNKNNK